MESTGHQTSHPRLRRGVSTLMLENVKGMKALSKLSGIKSLQLLYLAPMPPQDALDELKKARPQLKIKAIPDAKP